MERVKKNDPVALSYMGKQLLGKGNYRKALEYLTKAADLGDADAHCGLGYLYYYGDGVDKDEEKEAYHFEQAAIGGHPQARGLLADREMDNGRFDRAAKHLIIAANLGDDRSLQEVKDLFVEGIVSKEEYASALRGYQTSVNETKSAEREEGEVFYARN
jgi:TPR repeat protein